MQPFDTPVNEVDPILQETLIELQCNEALKVKFRQMSLHLFWTSSILIQTFPSLWREAELYFVAFPTSYLVESGFSSVVQLLTRSRNRLEIDNRGDLRLALSEIDPEIENLVDQAMN